MILDLAARMKAEPFAVGRTRVRAAWRSCSTSRPCGPRARSPPASPSSAASRWWSTPGWPAIGKRESVADVARVLGRQAAAIVWRTFAQDDLAEMAAYAGVPVVNALTDDFHPCQILADLLTIREHAGALVRHDAHLYRRRRQQHGATPTCWAVRWPACTSGSRRPEGFQPDPAIVGRAGRIAAPPAAACRHRLGAATQSPAPTFSRPTPGCRWGWRGPDGPGGGLRAVRPRQRAAGPGEPGRDRAALPAGLPRQGDHRGRDRRSAVARSGTRRRTAGTSRRRCWPS